MGGVVIAGFDRSFVQRSAATIAAAGIAVHCPAAPEPAPLHAVEFPPDYPPGLVAAMHPGFAGRFSPGLRGDVRGETGDATQYLSARIGGWRAALDALDPDLVLLDEAQPIEAAVAARCDGRMVVTVERITTLGLGFIPEVAARSRYAVEPIASPFRRPSGPVVRPASPWTDRLPRRRSRGEWRRAVPQHASALLFVLEPEPAPWLVREAPFVPCQHAAIARVARDLPAGAQLMVLEHPAMVGHRPSHFYRQVSELPMACLLDPRYDLADAIDTVEAVVCVAGEAGWLAPLLGRPVIVLGSRHHAHGLEGVLRSSDLGDLKECLQDALAPRDRAALAQRAGLALSQRLAGCWFRRDDAVPADVVRDILENGVSHDTTTTHL